MKRFGTLALVGLQIKGTTPLHAVAARTDMARLPALG